MESHGPHDPLHADGTLDLAGVSGCWLRLILSLNLNTAIEPDLGLNLTQLGLEEIELSFDF